MFQIYYNTKNKTNILLIFIVDYIIIRIGEGCSYACYRINVLDIGGLLNEETYEN